MVPTWVLLKPGSETATRNYKTKTPTGHLQVNLPVISRDKRLSTKSNQKLVS